MKRASIAGILALWALCCALSFAEPALRFARIENIPDQYVGGEILKAVYARLGIAVEFIDMPAQRALVESSSGKVDGAVQGIAKVQDQYPTLLMVKPAINTIEPSAFVSRLRIEVLGWGSIRRYRVGIVRGVGSSEDGTRGMPHVTAFASLDPLMEALAANRVDVAVSDSFSGLAAVRKLGLRGKVSMLSPPLQRIDVYHFLNIRHRELLPRVEDAIAAMQASGELEALRRKLVYEYVAGDGEPSGGR
jgi:ABC-type amino acid transport substrate-binding protein